MEDKLLEFDSLGQLVERTFNAMIARFNQQLREKGYDIQHAQYTILSKLFYRDLTQKQLAALTRKDSAAINRAVKTLIDKGYVMKREGNNSILTLTDKALGCKDDLLKIVHNVIEECVENIPDSRRDIGKKFLFKIYRNATMRHAACEMGAEDAV